MRALIAATAAAALVATAPAAFAVTPKGGVELYGHTSIPGDLMFMTVSPSGEKLSVFIGTIENVIPPRIKRVKISDAGRFSATREVVASTGTEWTIKIKGKFTARTKAEGTFSAEGITHRGGGDQPFSSHGEQTFKVHLLKNS